MPPQIFTLEEVSLNGSILNDNRSIHCAGCQRQVSHYEEIEFSLEAWPRCDLISDTDSDQLFISERQRLELEANHIEGYHCEPITMSASPDLYPEHDPSELLPVFHYLIIARRLDGPWDKVGKGDPCPGCGFPRYVRLPTTRMRSADERDAVRMGDVSGLEPVRVFKDEWKGEDIFFHSQGKIVVITERLAELLKATGNLRRDEIAEPEREETRRLRPNFAAVLEKYAWQRPACSVLGPAQWVDN